MVTAVGPDSGRLVGQSESSCKPEDHVRRERDRLRRLLYRRESQPTLPPSWTPKTFGIKPKMCALCPDSGRRIVRPHFRLPLLLWRFHQEDVAPQLALEWNVVMVHGRRRASGPCGSCYPDLLEGGGPDGFGNTAPTKTATSLLNCIGLPYALERFRVEICACEDLCSRGRGGQHYAQFVPCFLHPIARRFSQPVLPAGKARYFLPSGEAVERIKQVLGGLADSWSLWAEAIDI